jgi:hypothetical protein
MIFVISNIDTWAFLKTSFNLASALIIVRLALSWSPFFLMYSQILRVTSVRGSAFSPMTAAKAALGVIAFMKAALGARFFAGAAFFAAGNAVFIENFGAPFFAGAALTATFFAVAIF